MRSAALSVSLIALLFLACGSSDTEPHGPADDAGAAGEGSAEAGAGGAAGGVADGAGAAGTAGAADAAGSAGADGVEGPDGTSACAESGRGEIELVVTGLPVTVAASITVSGALPVLESESTTLRDVQAGRYTVSAKRVYDADVLVRTAYAAQVSSSAFCLEDGLTQTVTVSYSKLAPSNQLWTLGGNGAPLLGFAAAKLTDSGSPAATSSVDLPLGTSMAFDQDGNMWAAGASAAEATVSRYASAWLAGVGVPHADFAYRLPIDCQPSVKAVALDASGNVWLSACGKQVLRIDRPVTTPGADEEPLDIAANVTLSGFSEQNEDLAFDSAGNLWVAAGGRVLRFDRTRLDDDDSGGPDLALEVTTDDAAPQALAANFLSFDQAGNLWASDFERKSLFEIGKAMLDERGTSSVVATVQIAFDASSRLSRSAFDDEGSLWLSLAPGKFGKLTAEQLAVSSSAAAPTVPAFVISSADVGHAGGLAFFPAASGLPLASAQP